MWLHACLILLLASIILYHSACTLSSLWRMLAPSQMIGWWFSMCTAGSSSKEFYWTKWIGGETRKGTQWLHAKQAFGMIHISWYQNFERIQLPNWILVLLPVSYKLLMMFAEHRRRKRGCWGCSSIPTILLGVLSTPNVKLYCIIIITWTPARFPETWQSRSRYSNRAVTPIEQSP